MFCTWNLGKGFRKGILHFLLLMARDLQVDGSQSNLYVTGCLIHKFFGRAL